MPRIVFGVLDAHRSHRIEIPNPRRDAEHGPTGRLHPLPRRTGSRLGHRPARTTVAVPPVAAPTARLALIGLAASRRHSSRLSDALFAGDPVARALAATPSGRAPWPETRSSAETVARRRSDVLLQAMAATAIRPSDTWRRGRWQRCLTARRSPAARWPAAVVRRHRPGCRRASASWRPYARSCRAAHHSRPPAGRRACGRKRGPRRHRHRRMTPVPETSRPGWPAQRSRRRAPNNPRPSPAISGACDSRRCEDRWTPFGHDGSFSAAVRKIRPC